MNVEIEDALAMVLPIPVVPGCADDAVSFVDLSGYPKFFGDMRAAFPEIVSYAKSRGMFPAQSRQKPKLEVHDVGDFVASFVPSPEDFTRLDERFRLSPSVLKARAEYKDYGFAVFQLKANKSWLGKLKRQTIHPMAFTFPSRKPNAIFYPTLHVHDNDIPSVAAFDHSLYLQTDNALLAKTVPFERSKTPLGDHVDVARAKDLIRGADICLRNVVMFEQPNADHWYEPPECAGAHILRGEGELFAFELCATAAYYTQFDNPPAKRWHRTARTKLDALHSGLLEGLKKITDEMRDEWALMPLTPDLHATSLSSDHVYSVSPNSSWTPLEHGQEMPSRIRISTRSEDAEPQQIDLGIRYIPTPERIAEIRKAFDQIVDRSVA